MSVDPFSNERPKTIYGRFKKIEGDGLVITSYPNDQECIISIGRDENKPENKRSMNVEHFSGQQKLVVPDGEGEREIDMKLQPGSILRLDGCRSTGEGTYQASWAKVVSLKPDAELLFDVPATIRETKGEERMRFAQIIDNRRSIKIEAVEQFSAAVQKVLEDDSLAPQSGQRHVMIRRKDGDKLDTKIHYVGRDDDDPLGDVVRIFEDKVAEGLSSAVVFEVTPVIDLLVSSMTKDVVAPASLIMPGNTKTSFARMVIALTPYEYGEEGNKVTAYSVKYARPRFKIEGNEERQLFGATKAWTEIQRKDREEDSEQAA